MERELKQAEGHWWVVEGMLAYPFHREATARKVLEMSEIPPILRSVPTPDVDWSQA